MGALAYGIAAVVWANIAIVATILAFLGGDILAAITLLGVVFATPFVLNKIAEVL